MKIAIVGAGFPPGEADRLRRAMATFKRNGEIHLFRDKFIAGMVSNGYSHDFATRCFDQIEGFGTYGFPESHAASFALLVYVSAWIKCFHPDVFACALLNSQPMGFYAPAQIVRDAGEHGVAVRGVDINHSQWDCTLELSPPGRGPSLEPSPGGRGPFSKPSPAGRGPFSKPPPSGRGQGEGACRRPHGADMISPINPHPNPLPEGEGIVRGMGEGIVRGMGEGMIRGETRPRALRLGL